MLNLFCHLVRFYNLVLSLRSESSEWLMEIFDMEKVIDENVITNAKEATKKAGAAKRVIGKKSKTTEKLIEETTGGYYED